MKPFRFSVTVCESLLILSMSAVRAQQYPIKPIRILGGFAAGGPSDVGARTVGSDMPERSAICIAV